MKKRVLIVTAPLNVGGFDVIATNLQAYLDKSKFECTFYIKGEKEGPLEPKVIENGAKVIHKPDSVKGYINEYKHLKQTMIEGKFDIVHSHLMFYSGLVMRAAYKAGVKKRVPHSHMTNPCIQNRPLIKRIEAKLYSMVMKRWLNKYGTDLIACGPEAGTYQYGKRSFSKRGIILNNAIELDKFRFDPKVRNKVRDGMNFDSKLVVGHVGRLNYVKNHTFLLDVFFEIQKNNPESVLLIVGDGEQRTNIENKAKDLGISDKVIVTGIRSDVSELLMAMDVFVFPSLYEGLPVTLVEAQATKLPCLISDSVTKYAKQNDNTCYLPLKASPKVWAQKAIELANCDRESVNVDKLNDNYDIRNIVKQLEQIYLGD
ncbi:MAG: glycosyltransferase family 1 protein [Clostridia bacterium]|nr:glycosyltransferase family 1 protein [Clostridia bacterium]